MTVHYPRLLAMGDAAWSLELGASIDAEINQRCQALAAMARTAWHEKPAIRDIVPTFRSVTVYFDPLRVEAHAIGQQLLQWADQTQGWTRSARQWRLPVYFGGEHGLDLNTVAERTCADVAHFIDTLSHTDLQVYAMGFMPGFAYMASLPEALRLPRLSTPRTQVPAQTLAIAQAMACVYPWASPGGWHLLGHMPIQLFDPRDADAPALLQAGDAVRFYAVDQAECQSLLRAQSSDVAFRQRFRGETP